METTLSFSDAFMQGVSYSVPAVVVTFMIGLIFAGIRALPAIFQSSITGAEKLREQQGEEIARLTTKAKLLDEENTALRDRVRELEDDNARLARRIEALENKYQGAVIPLPKRSS